MERVWNAVRLTRRGVATAAVLIPSVGAVALGGGQTFHELHSYPEDENLKQSKNRQERVNNQLKENAKDLDAARHPQTVEALLQRQERLEFDLTTHIQTIQDRELIMKPLEKAADQRLGISFTIFVTGAVVGMFNGYFIDALAATMSGVEGLTRLVSRRLRILGSTVSQ